MKAFYNIQENVFNNNFEISNRSRALGWSGYKGPKISGSGKDKNVIKKIYLVYFCSVRILEIKIDRIFNIENIFTLIFYFTAYNIHITVPRRPGKVRQRESGTLH